MESSLDTQLDTLEQTITGTLSSSSNSSSSSSGGNSTPLSKWSTVIRAIVSAALAGGLLAGFRPIWLHSITYEGDDEYPQKKILWIRAAGAWVGLTLLFFFIYHFILSRYISWKW
jgi:hypothetical protein